MQGHEAGINPDRARELSPPGVATPSSDPVSAPLRVPFEAVIFDMDGVVTDTASVHAAAWKRLFDEVLAARDPRAAPFDPDVDYRRDVDGRTRGDGVAAFLAARGIDLARGGPDDPPGAETVWSLAARKNRLFEEAIASGGVR